MEIRKKIVGLFMVLLFLFVLVGCDTKTTTTSTQTTASTQSTTTTTTTVTDVTTVDPTLQNQPKFVGLMNNQTYYRGSQEFDILDGAKAIDAEDGELEIQIVGSYSTTRTGKYEVYAVAEDSDGNVITELVTLTVKNISDFTIPETLSNEQITITMWHSNGASIETALNDYARDFKLLYPNINVVIVKNGNNYDELRQNMVNAIRGGQIPNIVQNYPDHVMEYLNNNAVIPLTPYIYHPTWGYNPDVVDESFQDILLNYRRENSQYTPDGEYYSLPFNKSTEVMIYNKTMFDMLIEQGVIDKVPETWQGLFEVAPYLFDVKDEVIDSITTKLNSSSTISLHKTAEEIATIKSTFSPITYDSPANAFITLTRQWGGEYTSIDASRKGIILFDNIQTRSMLSYFFDNRDNPFTLPGKLGTEYASDAFKVGQTAVTFGSTGGARYNTPAVVNNEFVVEFGVAPMPYNADMPENRTAIQQGTNVSVTSAGTDQQKLASWLFVKYLTSRDVQLDFALETGYSPVRSSVYDLPAYLQFIDGFDSKGEALYGEALMKSMGSRAAALQSGYLFYDQAYIGSSKAREAVEAAFERVILGSLEGSSKQKIIDDAIAAAKSEAERAAGVN